MGIVQWLEKKLDCPNCGKAKHWGYYWIYLGLGVAMGINTFGLFFILGTWMGVDQGNMQYYGKLPMLLGTTAFMWWIIWQGKSLICSCDEIEPVEDYDTEL